MIKIEQAELDYNKFKLGPISLKFDQGEFVSVVGPSGSGKSTLIKVITGHNKLSKGRVEYLDCSSEDISYISQSGTTFNHLNVRDNLTLKYDYSDQQIIDCLNQVGLSEEFIAKYPFELSGGERQRIDLVRALLSNSKYIVLDESMSALDRSNKQSISQILKEFVDSRQISIIYITHDVMQAIEYSSRIIGIADGQLVFDGPASQYPMTKAGV